MSVLNKLIEDWLVAKVELGLAKKKELKLRAEILENCFTETSGTLNTFHDGFMIKGTFGINHKLDADSYIDALEAGDISEEVAEVINFKPTLNKSAYQKLPDELSAELDDFITTAPSLPTLAIKVSDDG